MSNPNLSTVEFRFVEPTFEDPNGEFEVVEDPEETQRWRDNFARWESEIRYLRSWHARSRPTARRTKLIRTRSAVPQ